MGTKRTIHVSKHLKDIFDNEISVRIKNLHPILSDSNLSQEFRFEYMMRYCLGEDYESLLKEYKNG